MATIKEIKQAYKQKFYMLSEKLVEDAVERFGDSVYTQEFLIFCADKKRNGELIENQDIDSLISLYEEPRKL